MITFLTFGPIFSGVVWAIQHMKYHGTMNINLFNGSCKFDEKPGCPWMRLAKQPNWLPKRYSIASTATPWYGMVCVSLELSNWAALIDLEQDKLKTENYSVL